MNEMNKLFSDYALELYGTQIIAEGKKPSLKTILDAVFKQKIQALSLDHLVESKVETSLKKMQDDNSKLVEEEVESIQIQINQLRT